MKPYHRLVDIQRDLKAGEIQLVALVEHYLGVIASKPELNAFLEVYRDEALQAARDLVAQGANTESHPLLGAVIGVKDVIAHAGHSVTAASKILEGFESLYTATALQRLIQAGAIPIGRLNCDEFAMGSSNENSSHGAVLNPHDPSCVAGGSSGGSAAAVAAGMCLAAIGTDTGGSIRLPASFCGTVGFKPSYGRVSRYGLLAYASSFDQIGMLSQSVEDAALLTSMMSGPDDYDATVSSRPPFSATIRPEAGAPHRLVYFKETLEFDGLNDEVRLAFEQQLQRLESEGHHVEARSFPYLDHLVPAYYVLTTAEASSNLARYDGVRFGRRAEAAADMEDLYRRSRGEGFGAEVKRRIMLGTFVLSAGYYDAYYGKAQSVRGVIKDYCEALFREADFIISPTTATPAFKVGERSTDPIAMYLSDQYTVLANLAGLPSISLPNGTTKAGLPFGLQLTASRFEEDKLLSFSAGLGV